MLAKFNETMEPLYMLLKEIEDIRLTAELLDPDIDSRIEQPQQNYDGTFSTGKWSDKNKGLFGHAMANMNHFNVKIDDTDSSNNSQNQPKKEQPIWMMESTISGAANSMGIENGGKMNKMVNGNAMNTSANTRPLIDTIDLPSSLIELSSEQAKEVLEILLSYEKPNDPRWFRICKYFGFANDPDDDGVDFNDMNDDPMNQNGNNNNINVDMNFFNRLPFIRVNGHLVSLIDLSDEHIVKMNDMEKQDYIRTAQQLYATVFDI